MQNIVEEVSPVSLCKRVCVFLFGSLVLPVNSARAFLSMRAALRMAFIRFWPVPSCRRVQCAVNRGEKRELSQTGDRGAVPLRKVRRGSLQVVPKPFRNLYCCTARNSSCALSQVFSTSSCIPVVRCIGYAAPTTSITTLITTTTR